MVNQHGNQHIELSYKNYQVEIAMLQNCENASIKNMVYDNTESRCEIITNLHDNTII